MNIVFFAGHHFWGGLRCCGGSRTILLSAEVLRHLGHTVNIVAFKDNFNWFQHHKSINHIPKDTDACIACSISDIKPMHEQAPKGVRLYYWMRALELWQMPEKKIYSRLNMGQKNIVNSTWLERLLNERGIPTKLVWPGVDMDWVDSHEREKNEKPTIGALYNAFHKTKRWDLFVKLHKVLGKDYNYKGFGYDNLHEGRRFTIDYLQNPERPKLMALYGKCNIWFAPTELDSFHNVAAEANLCGCLVVCNNKPSNGMEDYATPETAMIFKDFEEAVECCKNPDYSKVKKMQELLLNKIGSRETNMKKLLEVIQ